MVFRILTIALLAGAAAWAQQGDETGARMDPVVPENLIPPSPVLTVAEALESFRLEDGFLIEPVAAEPLVDKPVCLDFDAAGRMWVCEMRDYMPDIDGMGEAVANGRIVILEDTDGDGRADKRTVFLDKLPLPRAVLVFEKEVLVMDEERLVRVPRDGDKPAGPPVEIDFGATEKGNVEHKPNGLLWNLDNRVYLAKSDRRLRRSGGEWVAEPTTFRGQWGIARDDWGRLYHNNNSTLLFGDPLAPNLLMGNPGVRFRTRDFVQLGSNRVWPARVTPGVNRAYVSKAHGFTSNTLDPETFKLIDTTAAAGMTIYRGTDFPKEWYGMGFTTEPVSNLVKATRIVEKGGTLVGSHPLGEREFLASTDERFRPVNACTAPDGSLYIVDMYHGIIQHETYMTSYLRKQTLSRGLDGPASGYGRIYRIRSKTGALGKVADLGKSGSAELVTLLGNPNAWQREMAQRLLVERADPAVVPALAAMAAEGRGLGQIDAIWTLEGMGALRAEHLISALRSGDAKVESSALWAATRLDRQELEKLAPVLVALEPAAPEVAPYLARALGPVGTPAAFARLEEVLAKAGKWPFVREAAVSGLNGHEEDFRAAEMADSKDAELLGWLKQGAAGKDTGRTPAKRLKGAAAASFARGKALFHGAAACFGCHSADGAGIPNLGPPLDGSQWVVGNPQTLAKILLHGLAGPVTVDGTTYTPAAEMPGLGANPAFDDRAVADLLTYIRNEWSNAAPPVRPKLVATQRQATAGRNKPWAAAELGGK